ncbi:hypothetical protein [Alicyclobacillus kakegawensis]|uniref:hypothetical protein n=1 Tax=Alicyclobacillus kakegawensis TaxID=392012 RepID=UPI0008319DBC|nr:hypothetical protein [Alicyclobacillus kakegawensis]
MMESLLWDVVLLVLLVGLGWYYMRLQRRLKKGPSSSMLQAPLLGAGLWTSFRRPNAASATMPDGAGAVGAGASPDRLPAATTPVTGWDQEEIEKILSGIYEDVAAELTRLREHLEAQIEQLRAELQTLQQGRLTAGVSAGDALATASTKAEGTTAATDDKACADGAAPGAILCDEATAYRALELLYAGCSDEEAARRLGVETSVIASVRGLLLAPAGARNEGQASRPGQAPGLPADGNL